MRLLPFPVCSQWKNAVRLAINFTYPPACPLCGAVGMNLFLNDGLFSSACCRTCQQQLAPPIENSCQRCGAETGPYSLALDGCVHCRRRSLAFTSVVCLGMYRGRLKRAMLSAKWSYASVAMESLAALLWEQQGERLQLLQVDRILPVPQHWQQRLMRHFNPAMVISDVLSRRLRVPSDPHILRRSRRTRPQKRVAVGQRFANQRGAFHLRDAQLIRGERLLIVDDVLTTGATCSEAARLLKAAGAAACDVGVIGRVLDHSA